MKLVAVILALSTTSALFADDPKDYSYLSLSDLAVISFDRFSLGHRILDIDGDNLIVDTNPLPDPIYSVNIPKKPVPRVVKPGEMVDDRYSYISGKRVRESRPNQSTGVTEELRKDKIRFLDKKSGGIIYLDYSVKESDGYPGTLALRKPDGGATVYISTGQTVRFAEVLNQEQNAQ
jgi:hypothetical protein